MLENKADRKVVKSRGRQIALVCTALLILAGIGAAIYFSGQVFEPKDVVGPKEMLFRVNPGERLSAVAKKLSQEELINSSGSFTIYGYLTGSFRRIQAGVYKLSSAQSPREILGKMVRGDTAVYRLTIPEGWRVEQIAQKLISENRPAGNDFLDLARPKEGYLFPDTYEFLADASAEELVNIMRKDLDEKTKDLVLTRDDIIIASIVEREAKRDEDRPKIAAVYKNRLRVSQNLESDPTVQYARDTIALEKIGSDPKKLKDFKFWEKIQSSELKSIQSPYNTYLNNGLPPGPICNPGMKSLEAVTKPEPNFEDYFYFFNLESGETIFSHTFAEHLEKLQQYSDQIAN